MMNYFTRSHRICMLCSAGLLPALLFASLCIAQEQKPQQTQSAPQTFHNLKILKGVSVDELYTEMRRYDRDLGVGCGFCHVSGFEKDSNPHKLQARQMLLMTRKLNKSYPMLKGRLTCGTECESDLGQTVSAVE